MKYLLLSITAFMSIHTMAQKPAHLQAHIPTTKTVEQTDDFFGTKVNDPYRWLENDTAADTKDWVVAAK